MKYLLSKMESQSSIALDDVRPFGQLADWTPEETDGDSQDDALRLMDGSEIASVKECL